jgi:starch phosphorylase
VAGRAQQPIDYLAFSRGEHVAAARDKLEAESLNWVLYPDDSTPAGRELRLKQEFFLVSASLQDMLARHLEEHRTLDNLGAHACVHLNDTHPALAVPELMRLLVDEHGLGWDAAWAQTRQVVSYTNHTLMPEALETWPVRMLEQLLPRHLEIIYEINGRFLAQCARAFRATRPWCAGCRWWTSRASSACAWPRFPSWPRITSTASRPCTRN